ncbi:aspartyl-trna synthetase [Pseudooceanicola sp. HF7]|nr:aspartyl-trna synthetase [Pseudooceanicola sp. HF7]
MRHWRTSACALVVTLFSGATLWAATDVPGLEGADSPTQEATENGQQSASLAMQDPLPAPEPAASVGPVTNLPLPRFVSMKSSRANVRRGPSKTHRIDWEFLRKGLPVEIIAEYGHWRRIRDHDGMGGWVHYALISGHRTVLVEKNLLELRFRPGANSRVTAKLEAGVIADLEECEADWCQVSVAGYSGWAPKTALWGVGKDEIVE